MRSPQRRGEAKAAREQGYDVFRDPNEDDRVWVVFDLDEEGYRNLMSDPDMPAIFQEGGLPAAPQAAELARQHHA